MIRLNHFKLLIVLCSLFIANAASAQTIEERTVEGRKVFICNMSDRDTFKTAEEGCKHWAEKHTQGYTYKSSTVQPNGAVLCICTKAGSSNNEQQGQIMGINICPENASASPENQTKNYKDWTCLCYQGFKAKGKICEKDSCAPYFNMSEAGLKGWAQAKLQKFCDEENEAFKKDPSGSIKPKSGPPILNDSEVMGFLQLGSKKAKNGEETYADFVWNMVYGHVLERMIARRVEKDECLKQYLEYVKNSAQMKEEGTNPDFRGKGKLPAKNEFDVTTPEQVIKKMQNPAKQHFVFITYSRLFTSDDLAASQPAGTNPKPPKIPIPTKPPTTNPKPPTTTPKPPAKPPKSSTDGK